MKQTSFFTPRSCAKIPHRLALFGTGKYLSFFRLRFSMGLQYRVAALAAMSTQFVWGCMEIMMFHAFYRANPDAFPMTLPAIASYVWFQQAFLALFAPWMLENEIFDAVMNGNIAYELCRPVALYPMWFARSLALRLSRASLRCVPILLFAALLPEPYGLTWPIGPTALGAFLLSLVLSVLVVVAFGVIIYGLTFRTISPRGVKMFLTSLMEFFTGSIIPLPFLPEKMAEILELLPFAAMQNVPLRIYSGDLSGPRMTTAIELQIFWLIVLVITGYLLCHIGQKHVTVQGG